MFLDQLKQKASNMTCLFYVFLQINNILDEEKSPAYMFMHAILKQTKLFFKKLEPHSNNYNDYPSYNSG